MAHVVSFILPYTGIVSLMSLGSMSHFKNVDFKKSPCRCVGFRGLGAKVWVEDRRRGGG